MNRVVTPNTASVIAFEEWRRIVLEQCEKQSITKQRLAKIANVERKTIYAWLNGSNIPRLDSVAQIFSALGLEEIRLPLTDKGLSDHDLAHYASENERLNKLHEENNRKAEALGLRGR